MGPLARFALNYDRLSDAVRDAAASIGVGPDCRNPFKSILVRSLEMLHAYEDALRMIDRYEMPDRPVVDYEVAAGEGFGCSEAPRGICWHRYRVNAEGLIEDAQIVPPTSQNQPTIEKDLHDFAARYVDLPDEQLQWKCEQAIRNYDPCISCSCHFLKLHVDRA